MKIALIWAGAAMVLLGACQQEPEPAAPVPAAQDTGPAPAFYSYDGWIGSWTGVEGMFLKIAPVGDGTYQLDMQSDLDTTGSYIGTPTAQGIEFDRAGAHFILHEATGAQTGLKYLDGKLDCMMVAAGEGYCRD